MRSTDARKLAAALTDATGLQWRVGRGGYPSRVRAISPTLPFPLLRKERREVHLVHRILVESWTEPSGSHPSMTARRVEVRLANASPVILDVRPGRGWAQRAAEAVRDRFFPNNETIEEKT